jgi:hypothetical protein
MLRLLMMPGQGPDNQTAYTRCVVFRWTVADRAARMVRWMLGFRRHRNLVLTTTLQPCLQCAGAIRLARIGTVRIAGHDAYWDGYHEFDKLARREARRPRPTARIGPRGDELGVFGLLISRFRLGNPRLVDGFDGELRRLGEGPVLDLACELEDRGELERLLTVEVEQALAAVWPRLQPLLQPAGS